MATNPLDHLSEKDKQKIIDRAEQLCKELAKNPTYEKYGNVGNRKYAFRIALDEYLIANPLLNLQFEQFLDHKR